MTYVAPVLRIFYKACLINVGGSALRFKLNGSIPQLVPHYFPFEFSSICYLQVHYRGTHFITPKERYKKFTDKCVLTSHT